jgi:proteasome accessory factor A
MGKDVTIKDFFSETPPDRIIGVESEITIQIEQEDNQFSHVERFIADEAIRDAGFRTAGHGYLDSGGRIYLDMQNLEVATAECRGPLQAAAADYAGILQLIDIVDASGFTHDGLFRNTGTAINGAAETTGYHENYLIPRSLTEEIEFKAIMPSYLASRMWAGSGAITDKFELSQKISGIGYIAITNDLTHRITHGAKPMAIIPPPGADIDVVAPDGEYARLEVRFADANFSKTINYLGFATASLALRIAEHKDKIDTKILIEKSFDCPGYAAQHFSTDLRFTRTMETLGGDFMSAVNYQELLVDKARELSDRVELPFDELQAINLWETIIEQLRVADLEAGDYAGLLELADFAIRHKYLRKHFSEEDLNSYNPEAVAMNLGWDRISPAGMAMRYWDKIGSEYVSNSEIDRLYDSPPATRARARGALIKENHGARLASWTSLTSKNGEYYRFDDPYSVHPTFSE